MLIHSLMIAFVAQTSTSAPDAELFDLLDRNGDGVVEAGELTDSQRPYFDRALRVADANEDGALTREELTRATTDPRRVTVNQNDRRRANFDFSRFDSNRDGRLSRDEIPAPLMERLERVFDRLGTDSIPISVLQQGAMSASSPQPSGNRASRNESGMMMNSAVMKRLDPNGDGEISPAEMRNAPYLARQIDRNGDGRITAAELSAAQQDAPKITPRMQDRRSDAARRGREAGSQESEPEAAGQFVRRLFDQLDSDGNGRLTGSEIPERFRAAVTARRKDGLTPQDFARILSRRAQ